MLGNLISLQAGQWVAIMLRVSMQKTFFLAILLQWKQELPYSLVCGVFVSVPRLDLHSKTLGEMSCFMWVLRRISLIIAENVQFVNNSLCKRLI
jgi:hypothetical protein